MTFSAGAMAVLAAGGFVAGVVNSLAGGGSLLTVPLLVTLGLPGTIANGTNRVAVVVQGIAGAWRFRAEGVSGLRAATKLLVPLLGGAAVGALVVANLPDRVFERLFGVLMLVLLVPILGQARWGGPPRASWSRGATTSVLFGIGVYGGAIQAGVGLFIVLALSRAGYDLVLANSIKMATVAAFTLLSLAIFVLAGQVVWGPALVLSAGTALGADIGARLAVRGGERVIRPALVVAVVALAGRMLGLY